MTVESDGTTKLTVVDDEGLGIEVKFLRRDDRHEHHIYLVRPSGSTLLLSSIEDDDDDPAWPASPPFQQVSTERRNRIGNVAMLVGMAGQSHWSASIEPRPADRALVFDVACRTSAEPKRIGSRYQIHNANVLHLQQMGLILLVDDTALLLTADSNTAYTDLIGEGRIHIAPVHSLDSRATFRWVFKIAAVSENDESDDVDDVYL